MLQKFLFFVLALMISNYLLSTFGLWIGLSIWIGLVLITVLLEFIHCKYVDYKRDKYYREHPEEIY